MEPRTETAALDLRPRFEPVSDFHREIKREVGAYFAERGISQHASWRFWSKLGLTMVWWAASWTLLVFWASSWATALPLALSLGLAMGSIGFNVQHDGGHGAVSSRRGVNRLVAFGLDFLGASSYVWNWKHNHFHHQYTNIDEVDDDLNAGGLIRMAPSQPRRFFHRFQALYAWPLYALLGVKWHMFDDYVDVLKGRIGTQPMPRPRGWELAGFVLGKIWSGSILLVIPMLVRPEPFWMVCLFYFMIMSTLGFILATVFQLAHVLCEAEFVSTREERSMGRSWAEHQLATTCDFCPDNRLVSAYVGGLNFQVEHHLFPRVCHEHYPAIAKIVRRVAAEHGLRHATNPTLLGALGSHLRWLHRMGRPTAA